MKKSLFIILLLLLFATGAIAADDDLTADTKSEPKYQIVITVKYNAVTADEAEKILEKALEQHETACKLDWKMEKASSGNLTTGIAYTYIIED